MPFRVLCHREIAAFLTAKLNSEFKITAFNSYDERTISQLIPDCEILVSWLATRKIIEAGKKLKLIQCWGVGVNEMDLPFAFSRGIKVSNLAGFNSAAVADYTLSAMLLLTTRLHVFDRDYKQHSKKLPLRAINRVLGTTECSFSKDFSFETSELAGKVLAIIGYGSIGQLIALRAKAFGMKILAIKRRPLVNFDLNVEFIGTLSDLSKVLKDADFVTVNLPLTIETHAAIGQDEFGVMKPTAFFINSSRSEIVDNRALLSALKNGLIAGAVLDVVDESVKKSFAKMNNVLVTPHVSGQSKESMERGIAIVAENMKRLINGMPLLNEVFAEKMY
jgi:phosphoglycerate dehydrogenase-like enzyme